MNDNKPTNVVPEWAINLKKRFADLNKTQAEFCRKYGIEKSTCSKWVNGVHTPNAYGRECLCEFLYVPDWNWFLSQDERDRLAADNELKRFLSSTIGALDISGSITSKGSLKILNEIYSLLKIFGFENVVKRFEARGDTASIASLIEEWGIAFNGLFTTLEPMLEDYCSAASKIKESYREEIEIGGNKTNKTAVQVTDELKSRLGELGEIYSFFLAGTFDALGNINFKLYKAEKIHAPEEYGKFEIEEIGDHDLEEELSREEKTSILAGQGGVNNNV